MAPQKEVNSNQGSPSSDSVKNAQCQKEMKESAEQTAPKSDFLTKKIEHGPMPPIEESYIFSNLNNKMKNQISSLSNQS